MDLNHSWKKKLLDRSPPCYYQHPTDPWIFFFVGELCIQRCQNGLFPVYCCEKNFCREFEFGVFFWGGCGKLLKSESTSEKMGWAAGRKRHRCLVGFSLVQPSHCSVTLLGSKYRLQSRCCTNPICSTL